jgi:hypothetical protein
MTAVGPAPLTVELVTLAVVRGPEIVMPFF